MGDKTISWDPDNEVDVARMERDTAAMKAAGYTIIEKGKGHVIATREPIDSGDMVDEIVDDSDTGNEGMAEEALSELKEMDPKPTIDEE